MLGLTMAIKLGCTLHMTHRWGSLNVRDWEGTACLDGWLPLHRKAPRQRLPMLPQLLLHLQLSHWTTLKNRRIDRLLLILIVLWLI